MRPPNWPSVLTSANPDAIELPVRNVGAMASRGACAAKTPMAESESTPRVAECEPAWGASASAALPARAAAAAYTSLRPFLLRTTHASSSIAAAARPNGTEDTTLIVAACLAAASPPSSLLLYPSASPTNNGSQKMVPYVGTSSRHQTHPRYHTRQSLSAATTVLPSALPACVCWSPRRPSSSSHAASSDESHRASSGEAGRRHSSSSANGTASTPSKTKSDRQPPISSNKAASGPPSAPATGIAVVTTG
mmetsp:Transcript_20623/g.63987  ORF Transcript_20623/g.63987 Transcript_20623/m.63987 type:complete len:250 (+) Transcript_20623:319-1068(+)